MAKKEPEKVSVPSQLKVTRQVADQKISQQIDAGGVLQQRAGTVNSEPVKDAYNSDVDTWDEYNASLLKTLFSGTEVLEEYEHFVSGGFRMNASFGERVGYIKREVDEKLRRLNSLKGRLGLFDEPAQAATQAAPARAVAPASKNIFVVHGHDNASKEAVARFLMKLGLNPVILHEQANGGRTIIEKFEDHADVPFAVVLMTPDDEANPVGQPAKKEIRARQNVVLELGFFIGKLGRKHVAALKETSVAVPSDINGVVYIDLDGADAWQLKLAKEIKNAGLPIDLNKAI